ncbi:MAG: Gfo/Idh/MocA family oxidoreductase [Chthoniobacterales bacterium]
MKRIRLGIVGCGEVTQIVHLPTLDQLVDRFQVTVLCDLSSAVLEGVGERWNIRNRVSAYEDLVRTEDVDAVLVANPNAFHAVVTLAALAAGKHVLVEKPMCISLGETDEIIAAQKNAKRIVQVGYMRRYADAFLEARRMVREMPRIKFARVRDFIGKNSLIIEQTSRVVKGTDVSEAAKRAAKEMHDNSVKAAIGIVSQDVSNAYELLLGLSSHDISAMRELLGVPKRILFAAATNAGRYISAAFDFGSYVCAFETGIDNIPRFDAHLEVYGSDQVVKVEYDTPYVRNLPIRLTVTRVSRGGGVAKVVTHPCWGDPFVAEWLAFHSCVVRNSKPKTDPSDFRNDLELFLEMVNLMKEGDVRQQVR